MGWVRDFFKKKKSPLQDSNFVPELEGLGVVIHTKHNTFPSYVVPFLPNKA